MFAKYKRARKHKVQVKIREQVFSKQREVEMGNFEIEISTYNSDKK